MNRNLLLVLLSALWVTGIASAADVGTTNVLDKKVYTITQQFGLCSTVEFTLKKLPEAGAKIKLRSYRYCPQEGNKQGNGGETLLGAEGLRQEVNWAGDSVPVWNGNCQYHIYVYLVPGPSGIRLENGQLRQTSEGDMLVNADEWVNVSVVKNNVGCVRGPAGPDAPKEPLNLTIK